MGESKYTCEGSRWQKGVVDDLALAARTLILACFFRYGGGGDRVLGLNGNVVVGFRVVFL